MDDEKKAELDDVNLESDLEVSRGVSRDRLWGKEIIRAIDEQDILRIIRVFRLKAYIGANINETVDSHGYGGYCWTAWIHKFRGDTAVHIAIKLKKERALSALLILDPDLSIVNDDGLTASDLALSILKKKISDCKADAYVN